MSGPHHVAALRQLYGGRRELTLPANWRERLPDPATYYAAHVSKLSRPCATGWASGCCPFHEDRQASFSVHLTGARGTWRCHASCGGGDLVGFHMRKTGLSFKAAVRELLGLRP